MTKTIDARNRSCIDQKTTASRQTDRTVGLLGKSQIDDTASMTHSKVSDFGASKKKLRNRGSSSKLTLFLFRPFLIAKLFSVIAMNMTVRDFVMTNMNKNSTFGIQGYELVRTRTNFDKDGISRKINPGDNIPILA